MYGLGSQDYGDNPRRFAFLCLAALEFARLEGQPVDVVHAHDWQAGLTPVYVKTRYASDPVLGGAATVFTIHNIAYQGNCSSDWLPQLGLGWDVFTTDGLEFWLHASLLKGGIMFADLVTTVSPRYADELMAPEFAFGFEGILRHRAANLLGILNGIDADVWNPAADRYLPSAYQADDLSGKLDAKRVLLDTYGLPTGDDLARRPVVGDDLADGGPEGPRPHRVGGRAAAPPRCGVRDSRHGRTLVRGDVAFARTSLSRPRRRADRLRRAAVARDRGGRRRVHDAVPV